MKLRAATNSDLQLLAEMNFQLIKDSGHHNPMNVKELKQRMSNWLQANYHVAIIEVNSTVVGYALWREELDFLYIRQFYICVDDRRNNIGKSAIESLKEHHWQGKNLRLEVLITNQVARSFWQAVGFNEYCLTMEYSKENNRCN